MAKTDRKHAVYAKFIVKTVDCKQQNFSKN